jgi:hypothetical protein
VSAACSSTPRPGTARAAEGRTTSGFGCRVKLPDANDTKFVTNIVECDVDDLRIGQDLEVVWTDHSDGYVLPRFKPIA